MLADAQARALYAPAAAAVRTPRDTEYAAFAAITRELAGSAEPAAAFGRLAAALHRNRTLWTALAADVAAPGNTLPADLRARIFHLAEFTRQHSSRVLSGQSRPDVLIEINRAVMAGLRPREDSL